MKADLAKCCALISHGVYVISVADAGRQHAFTAAWLMQVSFDPLMLAFSINPGHYSYQLLKSGQICAVNVLEKHQLKIAEHFGTPGLKNKLQGYHWLIKKTGAPVLCDSLAYFDCQVSHFSGAGDHQLVVCRVIDAGIIQPGRPMVYSETGTMDDSQESYPDALS